MFHILVLSNDTVMTKSLAEYADATNVVEHIEVIGDVTMGLQYVKKSLPNVIIVDEEMQSDSGNMLSFLARFHDLQVRKMPYLMVVSSTTAMCTLEASVQLGVDMIILKSSGGRIIENIRMLDYAVKKMEEIKSKPMTKEEHDRRLCNTVQQYLVSLGISPKAVGYRYLVDAILLIYDHPTPNWSRVLAKQLGKTAASIERAAQNAITRTWERGDADVLAKHYTAPIQSRKAYPTVTEFIYYYANKLRTMSNS